MIFPFFQLILENVPKQRGAAYYLAKIVDEIPRRKISRILRGEYTPSLKDAKALLKAVNVDMSDSDIKESLELHKQYQKTNFSYPVNKLKKAINISFDEEEENVFYHSEEIARKKYGSDPGYYTKYIKGLIIKDVERNYK